MIKLINSSYLIFFLIISSLIINMKSLDAHNKNNVGCTSHCKKSNNYKTHGNKNIINKKIDLKNLSNSCINNSLCRG